MDLDSITLLFINNLPHWRAVVSLIKNGAGIVSPKKTSVMQMKTKKSSIRSFEMWKSPFEHFARKDRCVRNYKQDY